MNKEELTARRHELVACADKFIIVMNELVEKYELSWFETLGIIEVVKHKLKEKLKSE